ncbi:MAG: hypothetical protein MR639_15450 [Clostridium sp.]|uniref:hypothetical protein n=1 Tax=Clostridium sp. TaxID=1506 RepID=UPI002A8A26E7|nr:hypothetical protein [Clostridium sp.]MDY5098551.1 hypothetical protein [Clostridium sp.]
MEKKVFKTLTEKKIERIKNELVGLDSTEWNYIKGGIDMYFSRQAANLKIDDLSVVDAYLKRGY